MTIQLGILVLRAAVLQAALKWGQRELKNPITYIQITYIQITYMITT